MITARRLEIASFEQLVTCEQEVVDRINSVRCGGWLLLLDPLRLLRELNVHLTDSAVADWDRAVGGGLFILAGRERAYDAVTKRDPKVADLSVRVRALVRPRMYQS